MSSYWNDACQYGPPFYNKEDKEKLATRVRGGDVCARERFVLSFMLYCEKLAYKYTVVFPWIEKEDLAQIGMLTVLECMGQAMQKYDDPFPYIVVAVRHEIAQYCRFQSGLIRIPETRDKNGNYIHSPYCMEDINEELEIVEESAQRDYSNLYQAIEKLKGRTKEVICRHYGLCGYAPESLPMISMVISSGTSKSMAGSYQAQALKQLRKHLISAEKSNAKETVSR